MDDFLLFPCLTRNNLFARADSLLQGSWHKEDGCRKNTNAECHLIPGRTCSANTGNVPNELDQPASTLKASACAVSTTRARPSTSFRARRLRPSQDGAVLRAEGAWVLELHPGTSQRTRSDSCSPGNPSRPSAAGFRSRQCLSAPLPSGHLVLPPCFPQRVLRTFRGPLAYECPRRGDVANARDRIRRCSWEARAADRPRGRRCQATQEAGS